MARFVESEPDFSHTPVKNVSPAEEHLHGRFPAFPVAGSADAGGACAGFDMAAPGGPGVVEQLGRADWAGFPGGRD